MLRVTGTNGSLGNILEPPASTSATPQCESAWLVISTQPGNVVATAFAKSLGRPYPSAVGFFFGNTELSLELWTVISGISGFYD